MVASVLIMFIMANTVILKYNNVGTYSHLLSPTSHTAFTLFTGFDSVAEMLAACIFGNGLLKTVWTALSFKEAYLLPKPRFSDIFYPCTKQPSVKYYLQGT